MEGFTPSFFLQLIIALGSGFGAFFAMKADLKNMFEKLANEQRLREEHSRQDDETHHDIRNSISAVSGRVSVMEGRAQQH